MTDREDSSIVPDHSRAEATIALASDHGGVELKALLVDHLRATGHDVLDLGTQGPESVDYPDIANTLAQALRAGRAGRGVLICGTGIGISIAINRHADMRGALVHDAFGARLARQHNDANVLVLGGRTTGPEIAKDCADIFLSTPFEGGRHARRVAKLGTPSA
ncbi:ribose 5-phosphate isomerase B [Rhodospirillum rubrum]|uniref:Ribose-5-phosphate isomerase n=1 Tax=Rhodospirillum rubrum (strain ATCC 11170 / ATH 1.1.1 / DSM 467 / LMG 4362 / NCIMB 8255 / S1) TaxID=269796 RepID=Q2RTB7_RHORT|nr:ribose 5-phosphate isomerase B [Rhodospirillum rubrum]ABC22628.1 ribose-5-phosphate isomerase [Rhodospirillum rubrum ATCC 11170]AEO48346.1 ribose 5-phosphate isomerase B [Rhodospirillum rubrum F11]MBK5954221.1 ribose 5-phosphate isomerase B [Rhodospirillum rubrum]QXG82250.1 ribose 5-phosphate isomerase B [Rhodospirillum rubrum]HAQ00130.1 ribose 5-phosphate isomerase B [Rhodospirillum rubrum]